MLSEDALEALLPSKAGELEMAKLAAPSRIVIYTLDKQPIIIDTSGKGDLIPTIFGLWAAPGALPRIYVKHPFVTQYLVNGADLMLPGADVSPSCFDSGGSGGNDEGFSTFEKEELVAVCVRGNPAPLAVGVAGLSSAQAVERASQGLKGKLVDVLQCYGDCLCRSACRRCPCMGVFGVHMHTMHVRMDAQGCKAKLVEGATMRVELPV